MGFETDPKKARRNSHEFCGRDFGRKKEDTGHGSDGGLFLEKEETAHS